MTLGIWKYLNFIFKKAELLAMVPIVFEDKTILC